MIELTENQRKEFQKYLNGVRKRNIELFFKLNNLILQGTEKRGKTN